MTSAVQQEVIFIKVCFTQWGFAPFTSIQPLQFAICNFFFKEITYRRVSSTTPLETLYLYKGSVSHFAFIRCLAQAPYPYGFLSASDSFRLTVLISLIGNHLHCRDLSLNNYITHYNST